ncbi:hypothetical protein DJ68_09055 [Halorubrum sp. C3]|nr:hypothetical protein DJ68_09055 [Halorubrum sp. C3]
MNREYKLAGYALAAALVLFTLSGVVVVSGFAPADAALSADGTPQSELPVTDGETVSSNATNTTQFNVTTVNGTAGTLAVTDGTSTCSGALRTDTQNATRTDVQVDDTTITLISDDATPFETIERQRLAEVIWSEVSTQSELSQYEHVNIYVNQYYETTARTNPLGVAGVTARPADDCLPTVSGEVTLRNETVDIHRTLPALDELTVNVSDSLGVLEPADTALLERLLVKDEHASYTIQNQFEDPSSLNATVVEASTDGDVELELSAAAADGRHVLVTVNLETETVVQSTAVLEVDMSNTVTNESADGATTITVETNQTTVDT